MAQQIAPVGGNILAQETVYVCGSLYEWGTIALRQANSYFLRQILSLSLGAPIRSFSLGSCLRYRVGVAEGLSADHSLSICMYVYTLHCWSEVHMENGESILVYLSLSLTSFSLSAFFCPSSRTCVISIQFVKQVKRHLASLLA